MHLSSPVELNGGTAVDEVLLKSPRLASHDSGWFAVRRIWKSMPEQLVLLTKMHLRSTGRAVRLTISTRVSTVAPAPSTRTSG